MLANNWARATLHGLIGAVCGIGLAAFFGFGSGMVTTHSRLDAAVSEAKVDSYASVCADEAADFWKGEKRDAAKLRALDAWDTREKLANRFSAELPIAKDKDLMANVTRRCASDLMTTL